MFDRGSQLSHVARPVVFEEAGHGLGRKFAKRLSVFLGRFLEKGLNKKRNIFPVPAKRRHCDRDDIQAEIEVVPEPPLRDKGGKILVRRRDKANVSMQRLISAHALECAFAEHPKNLHLRVLVDFTDFVQKQSPSRSLLEAAYSPLEMLR